MFRLPGVCITVVLCAAVAFAEPPSSSDPKQWHRLVGVIEYLQGDYPPAAASKDQGELNEQRELVHDGVEIAEQLGPSAAAFVPRLQSIQARVNKGEDPQGVEHDCAALVEDLVKAGGLSRSPKSAPDLAAGKIAFEANCSSCHGVDGKAQTLAAAALNPKPANFTDPERMSSITPYKAFNTTTFGVQNTAMAPFPQLSDKDRWAISFYVLTLRQPECDHNPPKVSLEKLATSTDGELGKEFGEKEVACLRRRIPKADEEQSLLIARGGVDDAMKLGAQGNASGAKQALLDAYLTGIEPVEPLLKSRNPDIVRELEAGFTRARVAAEKSDPKLQDEGRALLAMIDKARLGGTGGADFWSVFLQALLIVIREGFEATVVIAALLAVLKKMKQTNQARVVHIGWVSALVVGAVVFYFARHLIAGANREWMEGIVALVAVGMLLYAALWLNARSNTRKWMNKLRADMQGALGKGSAAGLFFISFSALGRESLETALFLQGLSIDSPSGAAWGAAIGCVALVGLVLTVNRVGYVLPMKPLFTVSTVVLFVTAVMLLGKGLHALQEVGVLPLRPIRMFEIEFLGIFPDAVSLVPQLLLALAPLVYWWIKSRGEPEAPAGEAASGR
ncbi:MAG: FTR1 family protein [Myxococcaceae bacterium]